MTNKNLTIGLLITLVIAIIGVFTPVGKQAVQSFAGTSNYDDLKVTSISVGSGCNDSYSTCTGTKVTQIISTTCDLQANFAITASTTRNVSCAVTGVLSGDRVFVELPTNTSGAASKFVVTGASASSTAGQIAVSLTNLNIDGLGGTVPAATSGFGSSTQVRIER